MARAAAWDFGVAGRLRAASGAIGAGAGVLDALAFAGLALLAFPFAGTALSAGSLAGFAFVLGLADAVALSDVALGAVFARGLVEFLITDEASFAIWALPLENITGNLAAMMPADDPHPADAPFFHAILRPHRSLTHRAFAVMMLVLAAVFFGISLLFWSMGAWPVVGFLGLDVALIYGAFHLNYRAARTVEEVAVSSTAVVVRRISPAGRARQWQFNPFFARLVVDRLADEGVTRIRLITRGDGVTIGAFLNPADRTSFAEAFAGALTDARRGRAVS